MTFTPYTNKDVQENSSKELFTVMSTFAGAGGSSTGYKLAGGNILAVNEFVESAIDTYKSNYPNTPILPNDIKELTGDIWVGQQSINGISLGGISNSFDNTFVPHKARNGC